MSKLIIDEEMPVLVEFTPAPGACDVGIIDDLEEKSAQALNSAMNTIRQMATYLVATMHSVSESTRPSNVEAKFGLKLTSEGNALITKAGVEANIEVTLTWELQNNTN